MSDDEYLRGLQAARDAVARQADLPSLVHFERPSDFRKGSLSSLAAVEALITEAQASHHPKDACTCEFGWQADCPLHGKAAHGEAHPKDGE